MPDPDTPPDHAPLTSCVGIVLAAGHGRRYAALAPDEDKLLAPLPDGRPVALAAVAAMRAATARTVAVVRPDNPALARLLAAEGCEVLATGAGKNGMGDSLAAVARHLLRTCGPDVQTCLVALGDMPWVRPLTCIQVARASQGHKIVAPAWDGRRGHPVAFHRTLWAELAALAGDAGARALLGRHPVTELAVDDPAVLADVDIPEDLTSAGKIYR
ncbi:NTP transferase domain-containing protein [Achromobacter sp. NPDC058515]|uniref:nucleotidyltransferase family protein n=1 Tax=Achromobacter sp. NPDC058515 TaxID=3346533 RepID=UPI0036552F90